MQRTRIRPLSAILAYFLVFLGLVFLGFGEVRSPVRAQPQPPAPARASEGSDREAAGTETDRDGETRRVVLNLEALQNLTLRVRRIGPGAKAEAERRLALSNEGAVAIEQIALGADPILEKEHRRLVAGRVEVSFDGTGRGLGARSTRELVLKLHGFDEVGTFQTAIVLQSPALPRALRIPLTIEVTDRAPLPLLVIALGVGLAFVVSQVAQRWRPREESRYRAIQLAAEIDRLRRTASPAGRAELARLGDEMDRADERNRFGAVDAANLILGEVEKALEAYRKRLYELRSAVWVGLDALSAQIESLEQAGQDAGLASTAEQLARLRAGMIEIRAMLGRDEIEDAEQKRRELAAVADAMARALAAERSHATTTTPSGGTRPVLRGHAPSENPGSRSPSTLGILEPQDARIAGAELSFQLTEVPKGVDEILWDFDDGGTLVSSAARPRATHRYARPGDYLVKASLRHGGNEADKVLLRLMVLPPRTDRALAQIRSSLVATEWALFGIALVLATLSGWVTLCDAKVFGTGANYITAFFWGFGIDSSIRGVTGIFKKISTN